MLGLDPRSPNSSDMPTLLALQEFLEGTRGGHPFLGFLLEAWGRAGRQVRALAYLDGEPGYCSSMETPPLAVAPRRSGLMSTEVVEKRLGAARDGAILPTVCQCYLYFSWCPDNWMHFLAGMDGSPNKESLREILQCICSCLLYSRKFPHYSTGSSLFQVTLWEPNSDPREGWWRSRCTDLGPGRDWGFEGLSWDYLE